MVHVGSLQKEVPQGREASCQHIRPSSPAKETPTEAGDTESDKPTLEAESYRGSYGTNHGRVGLWQKL